MWLSSGASGLRWTGPSTNGTAARRKSGFQIPASVGKKEFHPAESRFWHTSMCLSWREMEGLVGRSEAGLARRQETWKVAAWGRRQSGADAGRGADKKGKRHRRTWNVPCCLCGQLITWDWSFFFFKTGPALLNTRRRAGRWDDKVNTVAMETQNLSSDWEKKNISQFQICCEIYKLCQIMRLMKLCTGAILDIQKQAERVQACQIINHHRSLASMFQDFQCWSPELITFLTSEGMTFRTHALILYFLYDSIFPCFSATLRVRGRFITTVLQKWK